MREFEIREKQDKINQTDYWDGRILDLQILYFGDEVHLYIESYHENKVDLEECWKVSFLACAALNYETDAQNRKKFKVKDFTQNQQRWEMRVVLLPIYYKDENRIETCQIFIRDSEELCILDIDRDSGFERYEADSFFEALTNYRLDLEKEGGILQCNGADKCVFPSPMQMNFGGEKAYFLEMGKQASLNNVYEIFDQDKPNLNCVSVAEQKQFYDDWFTSLVGGSH